jgi:Flp pilus assembly pilin Flp
MKNKGQNILEFVIILALISVSGILVLILLGDNIKSIFQQSHTGYKAYKPFKWDDKSSSITPPSQNTVIASNPNPVITRSTDPAGLSTQTINGIDVNFDQNGSAAFTIAGQNVNISASMINSLNNVFETNGTSGLTEDIIAAIQKLITDHQAEYPGSDVPVQIAFGNGERQENNGATFEGNVTVNTVTLAVGNHAIVIQSDHTCTSPDPNVICDPKNVHKIEIKGSTGTVYSNQSTLNENNVSNITYNDDGLPVSA